MTASASGASWGWRTPGPRTSTAWAARASCSRTAPSRGSRSRSCWIPNVYAFCGTECALDYDGGLVQQLKQTGSCGTPANGIVARDLPRVGVVLEHRNSAENDCGNATMKTLWRVPIRRGAWVRILQHVRWSTDRDTGYIATWINGRPVQPSRDGAKKRVTRPGDEVRIHTWTLKDGPGVDRVRAVQVPSVRAPAKRHIPQPDRARRQRRLRGRHHRCKDARGGAVRSTSVLAAPARQPSKAQTRRGGCEVSPPRGAGTRSSTVFRVRLGDQCVQTRDPSAEPSAFGRLATTRPRARSEPEIQRCVERHSYYDAARPRPGGGGLVKPPFASGVSPWARARWRAHPRLP